MTIAEPGHKQSRTNRLILQKTVKNSGSETLTYLTHPETLQQSTRTEQRNWLGVNAPGN